MTKAAHICFTHELFSLFTLLQVSIPIPEIIIGTVIVNLGDGDTVGDGSAGPGAGGDGPAALHRGRPSMLSILQLPDPNRSAGPKTKLPRQQQI